MHIYADESGHSGKNIFAPPRLYLQGAILSVHDIEPLVEPVLRHYQTVLGVGEIHAGELGNLPKVQEIAHALMDALDAGTTWQLALTVIEKPYLATAKLVDTVFDSGENLGARRTWYNITYFRHILCCTIDDMLTPRNRQRFWEGYLAGDHEQLKASIRNARTYLDRYAKDRRLINVVLDAFEFVLRYPEEITLSASARKDSYKPHTPNMVAFSSLIQAIHAFAEETHSPPIAFYHDEQQEFGKTMREYHEMYAQFRLIQAEAVTNQIPLEMVPSSYDFGTFSMPSSKSYAPLQAVDVLLWVTQRANEPAVAEARDRIMRGCRDFYIGRQMSEFIRAAGLKWIAEHPISDEELERSRPVSEEMERGYKEKVSEFHRLKIEGSAPRSRPIKSAE